MLAFQAGPVTILLSTLILDAGPAIEALVAREGVEPRALAGSQVELIEEDGASRRGQVDQLGACTFDGLARGSYRLELALTDRLIIVERFEIEE